MKITVFLGHELKEDQAELAEPRSDGAICGQLSDRPKVQLLQYHAACERGDLEAGLEGKRYRVTEFTADGKFKMEPTSTR
jgi:hypothetical protein